MKVARGAVVRVLPEGRRWQSPDRHTDPTHRHRDPTDPSDPSAGH